MREGIALLTIGTGSALDEAVLHFDRAIELRRAIVAHGRTEYAFGLATGWLNRGDALLRKADPPSLEAALDAFEQGIALLSGLPWQIDLETRRRLAVGWQNRGLVLQASGTRMDDARTSFERALELIDEPAAEAIASRGEMLAAILVSLAGVLVETADVGASGKARTAALRALAHIDTAQVEGDAQIAEVAIKARYVLCRALAMSLPGEGRADASANDTVHLVTDAVDEGLAIARRWEQKGVDRFRGLAADLLRFGTRVYAKYQPHFLNEFVTENLDPALSSGAYVGSSEVRVARLEALWLSFSRAARDNR